jgi:hypothetical protein
LLGKRKSSTQREDEIRRGHGGDSVGLNLNPRP